MEAPVSQVLTNSESEESADVPKSITQRTSRNGILGPQDVLNQLRAKDIECTLNQIATVAPQMQIEYDLFGSPHAPTKVILIMGFATPRTAWYPFLLNLFNTQSRGEQLQILCLDNRGTGGSSCPSGRYTTAMMAADALAVIDHIHWSAFHICGVSMGGMISLELALLAPTRVSSLTLMVTHSGGPTARAVTWRTLDGYRWMASSFFPFQTASEAAKKVLKMLYSKRYLSEKDPESGLTHRDRLLVYHRQRMKEAVKSGKATSMSAVMSHLAAIATHRVDRLRCETMKSVGFPILVIGAKYDKLVNATNSEVLAKKLAADHTKYIRYDSGHAVNEEFADECAEELLQLIEKGDKYMSTKTAGTQQQTHQSTSQPQEKSTQPSGEQRKLESADSPTAVRSRL